jgi:hypothetical protein
MSLSDLASLGSLVSGVAVLISLVYLSLQVRQAEKNQRSLMQQGRADRASDAALRLAEGDLTPIYAKGMNGDESLNSEEIERFMLLTRAVFVSCEDSFLHHMSGQIDGRTWRAVLVAMRSFMSRPGLRAAWRLSSSQYDAEFVEFTNAIVAETPVTPSGDRLAAWLDAVRTEKAGASA